MATLAQEESRKTSERVKAGQKISRDNGVLYGNGNILGYDRVGDTYVINEEQAETVRMIYDLYLQGYGSMKIAKILTERKRKTASGLIKWSVSNIMRAIKNATYTGTKCYNKSRSNNFLEQKRINNLDMSTYEYVEGDFPSIISQEIWNKAQAIRESRVKPVCVSAGKTHIVSVIHEIYGSISYVVPAAHHTVKINGIRNWTEKPLTVINATISLTTELNGKELKSV